jgi:Fe-Mn family superoxide dismutase
MTRRDSLQRFGLMAAAATLGSMKVFGQAPAPATATVTSGAPANPTAPRAHVLPQLTFAYDALEPHIDAKTMEIHYSKHHQSYVMNLNKALVEAPPGFKGMNPHDLVKFVEKFPMADPLKNAIRNNAGGHVNHTMFWEMIKPGGAKEPKGELLKAIETKFSTFDAFKDQFSKAATGVFGSGWAWLTFDNKTGALAVESTPNQNSPITQLRTPLLGIDVWEHAYYLKYQNRRPEYITAFWNVVNWDDVASRHQAAVSAPKT